jgi:hypothetical protein
MIVPCRESPLELRDETLLLVEEAEGADSVLLYDFSGAELDLARSSSEFTPPFLALSRRRCSRSGED